MAKEFVTATKYREKDDSRSLPGDDDKKGKTKARAGWDELCFPSILTPIEQSSMGTPIAKCAMDGAPFGLGGGWGEQATATAKKRRQIWLLDGEVDGGGLDGGAAAGGDGDGIRAGG
jgi:hypothetical protein